MYAQGAVGGPLLTATGAAAEKALGQLLRQRYTRPGGCTDRFRGGSEVMTGDIYGEIARNHRKTIGKWRFSWETHRKTIGKWRF